MDRRIRPWINKKIIEYIGEEEPTLVDFVCSKVRDYFSLSVFFSNGLFVVVWTCCTFLVLIDPDLFSLQVMAHSTPQGILDDVAMVSC